MNEREKREISIEIGGLIYETIQMMDEEGIIESIFKCPICGSTVNVKIEKNDDILVGCSNQGCFHMAPIHRKKHWATQKDEW